MPPFSAMTIRKSDIRGCSAVCEAMGKEGWYRKPSPRTFGDVVRTFPQHDPLTDAELDRLGDFLKSCKGGRAMNVEALDGFFAALIVGPEIVMPSEYYPEVFGGEMSDDCEFTSLDQASKGICPFFCMVQRYQMRMPVNS